MNESRQLLEHLTLAAYTANVEGMMDYYNPAAASLWGFSPDLTDTGSLKNWPMRWLDHRPFPPDLPILEMLESENGIDLQVVRNDGRFFRVTLYPQPLKDAAGSLIGSVNFLIDMTDIRNEQCKGEHIHAMINGSEDAIISISLEGKILFWNLGATRLFGYEPHEIIGRNILSLIPQQNVTDEEIILRRLQVGQRIENYEAIRITKNGKHVDVSVTLSPVYDSAGRVIGASKIVRDISQHKKLTHTAYKNQERLHLLTKATNDIIWDWDINSGYVWRSKGYSPDDDFTQEPAKFTHEFCFEQVAVEDRSRVMSTIQAALAGVQSNWSSQYGMDMKDGSRAYIDDRAIIIRDQQGTALRILGRMTNITEQIQYSAHVLQSQKLEALGQLTGGVAHDFNNLLTVILGNADVLLHSMPEEAPLKPLVNMIASAAESAAEMTGRLLTFARKQVLDSKTVDVSAVFASIGDLLRRTLPTNIELHLTVSAELWNAWLDPVQLETSLLNLVINARDAMSSGGTIRIKAENKVMDAAYLDKTVSRGASDYVLISVSDTGCGMDEASLERVFEPFYTTKEVGKGSGLGLSMVYGFVLQSMGHIQIESEPGRGTTVRLYIPRTYHAAETDALTPSAPPLARGNETVMVVEDNDSVREHLVFSLEALGYKTLTARNGDLALHNLRQSGPADLLITDIIMPGELDGPKLADKVKLLYPDMPVMFISGYVDNPAFNYSLIENTLYFISKPYKIQELAQKIRCIFGAKSGQFPQCEA